jgi:hypothetical protein
VGHDSCRAVCQAISELRASFGLPPRADFGQIL